LNTTDNDSWDCNGLKKELNITKGQSPWEGWGTALKPANEPICVARKPLSEKSVALNVLKWGTGGINIDGCRVKSFNDDDMKQANKPKRVRNNSDECLFPFGSEPVGELNTEGRFPANIILECICDEVIKGEKGEVKEIKGLIKNNGEVYGGGKGKNTNDYISKCIVGDKGDIHTNPMCPCYMMDEQSGVSKSSKGLIKGGIGVSDIIGANKKEGGSLIESVRGHNDKGGASRFFYQAKVSKAERNMGLDGFEDKSNPNAFSSGGFTALHDGEKAPKPIQKNIHPTVKPVNLMAYLCRLVTPPNGIVLDPYMGSGATGIAAQLEGFRFVGMELDPDYFKIAEARIESYQDYKKFHDPNKGLKNGNTRMCSPGDSDMIPFFILNWNKNKE
jgi:site-specific DNA-methyltransferase (adenine-specific)